MVVSFVGHGSNDTGGGASTFATSCTPPLPAGIASGDRIFMVTVGTTTVPSDPSGWTRIITDQALGTGAVGASSGVRTFNLWYRDYDGVWTAATVTQDVQAAPSITGYCHAYRKDSGDTWDTPITGQGSDTTSSTSFSVTTGSMALKDGAIVGLANGWPKTPSSQSGASATAPGVTFGSETLQNAVGGTASGNDAFSSSYIVPVTTGATAAITWSLTLGTATSGGTIFWQVSISTSVTQTGTQDATAAMTAAITGVDTMPGSEAATSVLTAAVSGTATRRGIQAATAALSAAVTGTRLQSGTDVATAALTAAVAGLRSVVGVESATVVATAGTAGSKLIVVSLSASVTTSTSVSGTVGPSGAESVSAATTAGLVALVIGTGVLDAVALMETHIKEIQTADLVASAVMSVITDALIFAAYRTHCPVFLLVLAADPMTARVFENEVNPIVSLPPQLKALVDSSPVAAEVILSIVHALVTTDQITAEVAFCD